MPGHCFPQDFQQVADMCRKRFAEITAADGHSAELCEEISREHGERFGVYTDVFEQSIILDQSANRPWNFLASLSAELVVVSLVVLIPLAYRDHLPEFHWKSITMRPAPAPIPIDVAPTKSSTGTTMPSAAPISRPLFHLGTSRRADQPTSVFSAEAPPSIVVDGPGPGAGPVRTLPIASAVLPPPPNPPVHPATRSTPVRVSEGVQMAMLIRKVLPQYPILARTARISGVVHLVGTIAKDGTIRNLQLVSGHPLLSQAAMEAVRQWIYKPTLLNGEAVEVIAPIEVNFTLAQ